MSWLFSQGLVEAFLAESSLDGEQSALLKTIRMPEMCLSHAKTTEASTLSRYGTTCKLLTERLGEGLLMWYLEASRAKTSAVPEKVQGSKVSEVPCGAKWQELSERYDRDSHGWKTLHCSENEVLHWSSVTLPKWGMTVGGAVFQQQKSAQTTREIDSGYLLPTPTCHNAKEGAYPAEYTRKTPTLATHVGGKIHPGFTERMMGWPIGWTDLKPLETDKFQQWLDLHGTN